MKSLINLSPIFNFLKKKEEQPKEPTLTLSQVTAIFDEALMRAFDEALMRADDGIRDINWDDIEYDVEIDWDKRIYINNVDASDQVEEITSSIDDCFHKLLKDYVLMEHDVNIDWDKRIYMRKENNA